MPDWFYHAVVFVYGAVVGSFLNVLIWRLPRDESVVRPPSHCTSCGYVLKPYDNIPLVSWLLYKGKCRKCSAVISPRYFWVELLTALTWMAVFWRFGPSLEFVQFAFVTSALIAVFFIDLEHYIIPDQLWIFIAIIGFAADWGGVALGLREYPWSSLLALPLPGGASLPLPHSIVGFFVYGGTVLAVGVLGSHFFKKDAMGGGDVKLTAAIGANIGAVYGLISFFLAAAIGAFAGMALIVIARKQRLDEIPFGPMLVAGAVVMIFFGPQIIAWWLNYAGLT